MEKLNIAEILKDCPKGMELDCTVYENLYFDRVDTIGNIKCYIKSKDGCLTQVIFLKNGCYNTSSNAKCVIFPKGKTTWEGFQRPFKDGDIITCTNGICTFVAIYKDMYDKYSFNRYACLILNERIRFSPDSTYSDFANPRFATKEEKEKLFDAIKENGYKWNPETKTLEKVEVNKFDITTLKPFESRVLVRSSNDDIWKPAIWGIYNDIYCSAYPYITTYGAVCQCIPYEGNQHLLGTTDNCDEYYKTWE